jgi:predicted component of type VI protein secretion system
MDKMRELVQQSASSSTELSAAAEQMLKLSRNLLDNMDRFVIDRAGQVRHRHDNLPQRRQPNSESSDNEFAEVGRN